MEFFRINMLHRKTTYRSAVFQDFEALGQHNYHEIIKFHGQNRDAIQRLNFDEFFIMELAYCDALFQTEDYPKHIEIANNIIELSILNNVQFYQGEDIYHKTLFQKAQSHKTINQFEDAIHITKELLKMNTTSKEYQQFLKICYINHNTDFLKNMRSYGVLMIFVAAGLFVLNILLVEAFYPAKVDLFNLLSIIGLVTGGLFLIGSLSIHRWQARQQFNQFLCELLERENKSVK